MNLRDILEIVSSIFGLTSGGYFSVGVLTLKTSTLPKIAALSGGEMVAEELAKQKTDFAFGAVFLVLVFCVQIVTKIFPAMTSAIATNDFLCGVVISFFIAFLFWLASYFLHRQCQQKNVLAVKQGIAQQGK